MKVNVQAFAEAVPLNNGCNSERIERVYALKCLIHGLETDATQKELKERFKNVLDVMRSFEVDATQKELKAFCISKAVCTDMLMSMQLRKN